MIFACCALAADDAAPAVQAKPANSPRLLPLLPKYSPPKPTTNVDRRETDRPRNTIVRLSKDLLPPESVSAPATSTETHDPAPDGVVRLPRYDVQERRLPNFKEREILTPTARIDLFMKHHPGLHIGNLFGLNRGIAAAMIAEEDELDRRHEMAELLNFQAFAESMPRPKDDSASDDSGNTPTPVARESGH